MSQSAVTCAPCVRPTDSLDAFVVMMTFVGKELYELTSRYVNVELTVAKIRLAIFTGTTLVVSSAATCKAKFVKLVQEKTKLDFEPIQQVYGQFVFHMRMHCNKVKTAAKFGLRNFDDAIGCDCISRLFEDKWRVVFFVFVVMNTIMIFRAFKCSCRLICKLVRHCAVLLVIALAGYIITSS